MSKLGEELIEILNEAKEKGLIVLTPSPDVAQLRKNLHLSQNKFAHVYHINPETVKKWEQKTRTPDSISKAYLKCIAQAPDVIARLVNI